MPAFRDHGRCLATVRNDTQVIRDLVAIAAHRGSRVIDVRGQTEFRREVWVTARLAGLEVRGYLPTSREEQDLAHRLERAERRTSPAVDDAGRPQPPALKLARADDRLRVSKASYEAIFEPVEQSRIVA